MIGSNFSDELPYKVWHILDQVWLLFFLFTRMVYRGHSFHHAVSHCVYHSLCCVCVCVCVCVLVAQSCLTLCDPIDCSPPDFSVHGILQTSVLEWIAIPFSRGTSQPRDWTLVSCVSCTLFTIWAIGKSLMLLELKKELHNQKTELKSGLLKAVGSYLAAWTNLIQ